jgi:hypothetical protein
MHPDPSLIHETEQNNPSSPSISVQKPHIGLKAAWNPVECHARFRPHFDMKMSNEQ